MPQHDSFAEYLQSVPAAARPTLRSLRRTIQAVVPAATATLSYGIAAFRLDGRLLLGIGATAQHCAIYLMSAKTVRSCAELLADFDTSVGTVRFPHRRPPAPEIVRTLVETRLAEHSQPAPKNIKKTTEE
ncbi:MAG: iron chaperone [Planctomycetota bacterium]